MKIPTLTPVKSSHIQAIGHGSAGLFVQFSGGAVALYPEGTKALHDEMLKAESVGTAFREKVRGKLAHRMIDA